MNIDYDNMYSDILPKFLTIPSIKIIEVSCLTHSSEKLFLVTTKKMKQQAQIDIDSIIEQG